MLLILQITFTILSALCIAAFMPAGTFLGWPWAIGLALAAVMFFMLMKLCKQSLQFREEEAQKEKEKDFFSTDDNAENKE